MCSGFLRLVRLRVRMRMVRLVVLLDLLCRRHLRRNILPLSIEVLGRVGMSLIQHCTHASVLRVVLL